MLREMANVRQVSGEPRRRWFICQEMDLVVWEEEDGGIRGFQLAYDKRKGEHSFTWHKDRGFKHYVVDNGEPRGSIMTTPLLYANGPVDRDYLLSDFLRLSAELPPEIACFVEGKLREFDGPLAS